MNKELNLLVKMVRQKTGIDCEVYSDLGTLVASTRRKPMLSVPSITDFNEVFTDAEKDKTFFRFRYGGEKFLGALDGATEVEKNYAIFMISYLEGYFRDNLPLSRAERLKAIILGEFTRQQAQMYIREYSLPDSPCAAIIVSCPKNSVQLSEFLTEYTSDSAIVVDENSCVLVRYNNDLDEYNSATEFAEVLARVVYEENYLDVRIGVGGTVKGLVDINLSFTQALLALKSTDMTGSVKNVVTYKDILLMKMLEDFNRLKLSEYLDALLDGRNKALFTDKDMRETAEEFLKNDLNVSETARELYMHRNTLMYRLDKIERETGLDIKKFPDAFTYCLINAIIKILR